MRAVSRLSSDASQETLSKAPNKSRVARYQAGQRNQPQIGEIVDPAAVRTVIFGWHRQFTT